MSAIPLIPKGARVAPPRCLQDRSDERVAGAYGVSACQRRALTIVAAVPVNDHGGGIVLEVVPGRS